MGFLGQFVIRRGNYVARKMQLSKAVVFTHGQAIPWATCLSPAALVATSFGPISRGGPVSLPFLLLVVRVPIGHGQVVFSNGKWLRIDAPCADLRHGEPSRVGDSQCGLRPLGKQFGESRRQAGDASPSKSAASRHLISVSLLLARSGKPSERGQPSTISRPCKSFRRRAIASLGWLPSMPRTVSAGRQEASWRRTSRRRESLLPALTLHTASVRRPGRRRRP